MRIALACALLILAAPGPGADAQTATPSAPKPERLAQGPFDWPQVAARLWSDSSYTLRQAALESYVDSARLVPHSVQLRDSRISVVEVVLDILVGRPVTNAEIGELLAYYIGKHPDGGIVGTVAVHDTAGAEAEGAEIQRIVSYIYVHFREPDPGWHESFCIPGDVPRGLVVDEGEPLSMPRCDDTVGGDPWPVTTARRTALAYSKLFLFTLWASLLPLLSLALLFGALYLMSSRRRDGADFERRAAGQQARVVLSLLVLAVVAVAATLTIAVFFLSPNAHPLGIIEALVSQHIAIARVLAGPFALLVVVLLSARVAGVPAFPSARWRLFLAILLVLVPALVIAYGWTGDYSAALQDSLAASSREILQGAFRRARFGDTTISAAIVDLSILGFSVAVIGPVAEEFFWRGTVLPILERYRGPLFAVVVSAVLFGLCHLSLGLGFGPRALGAVARGFLIGSLLGVVFVKRRSLGWCVAIHSGWNALACVVALLIPPPGSGV
jgi:membrane protease YdiL (CAAX protease family)